MLPMPIAPHYRLFDPAKLLSEMVQRVSKDAENKADAIITDMETFDELPYNTRVEILERTGQWQRHFHYSQWEQRKIIYPQIMAELEALMKEEN